MLIRGLAISLLSQYMAPGVLHRTWGWNGQEGTLTGDNCKHKLRAAASIPAHRLATSPRQQIAFL